MRPEGRDAADYSSSGFGGGATFIFPILSSNDMLRMGGGFEFVNLMSRTKELYDPRTRLRTEQNTNQNFLRIYGGLNVGLRGARFLRPYASGNLALNVYTISTTLRIPDDFNSEKTIEQDLGSRTSVVGGFDLTFGLDVNVSQKIALDGGVRFVKSLAVPQQLGEGSVKISPQYFQIFVGIRLQGLGAIASP